MADIELTLNGDASGAVDAFSDTSAAARDLETSSKSLESQWKKLEDQEKAQAQTLEKLKAGFLAAGAMAVKFGVDSVKAYAEAERVGRQLERVAGDLTEAFERQADALESQLAIDGEVIKQQQTLLLQWGAAPDAIEPTIRAIEDYAAATGKDAVSATMELIKGVETGGERFKALGIQYEATGDRTKDLAALTGALAKRFGGSAEADAGSLQGGLNAVSIAFGNVQEAFGGLVGAMEQKSGVLEKTARFLQAIAGGVSGATDLSSLVDVFTTGGLLNAASSAISGPVQSEPIVGGQMDPYRGIPSLNQALGIKPKTDAQREAAKKHADDIAKLRAENSESFRDFLKQQEEMQDKALAKEQAAYASELSLSSDRVDADIKEADERTRVRRDMLLQIEKDTAAHAEKMAQEEQRMTERSAKESADRAKQQSERARQAGDAIGAAFVNALADQLSKLSEGGEFDAALFIGDILATAVSVAATVIGSAYGMPALGSAVGNLAATGIRAGSSALSANAKKAKTQKQYHSGGWVGADGLPRYHDGAWIGTDEQAAVLQTGERVLSRQEVHHMGGARAVDAAARGRGVASVVVNIQAIDSKSAAESFETDLADGMRRAQRAGRGMLPALLGGTPR